MGLWDSAQNTLDMGTASLATLQLFDRLTRVDKPMDADRMRHTFHLFRVVVVTMIEGYQGKLRGKQILGAIGSLDMDLNAGKIVGPEMIERFKSALL